ncbi:hypothetical protein J8N08_14340 [Agrobacterium tumefaciens]|uniref:hypothetical protein n=1 Tax=Agrobacterium tumefaciens TaxID=358 RepID=UPI001BB56EE8|nr:hypothetical protein J8N08_14340 [Agrobacterium tumefaciens]
MFFFTACSSQKKAPFGKQCRHAPIVPKGAGKVQFCKGIKVVRHDGAGAMIKRDAHGYLNPAPHLSAIGIMPGPAAPVLKNKYDTMSLCDVKRVLDLMCRFLRQEDAYCPNFARTINSRDQRQDYP